MSKLYKELKYDTDRVMQPGDPLTSPDGQTKVKANNGGTAALCKASSYEVTLTIPEVSGASFRVKFTEATSGGMESFTALITSISGLANAVADQYDGRGISVNGEYWGEVAVMATDSYFQESGNPLPDSSKRMPIFGGFYANFYLRSPGGLSSWCDWSNLSEPIETIEKEISTKGHTHSASDINSGVLPIAYGGTGVNGISQGSNKVLASPSTGSSGTIAFRSLVAADIPNLNTSKLTTGTLGVARGGTGKSSHTVNSVIIGGTSTTGALQNVATASGAFYATGANAKPQFGTLPVAQGGTGVNGSSQAINKVLASPASGSAGAISFRSLVEADIPTLSTSKISGLGDAATKNVGTTSGTVAAGDHTHNTLVSQDSKVTVTTTNDGTLTINKPGVPLTDNDTLASLATTLGLPDTASLSDVQQALGLPDTATLADAMQTAAAPVNTRFATIDELPEVPIKAVKQNGTALIPDSSGAVNVGGVYYATCSTAQNTAAKVATLKNANETFVLEEGVVVYVKFTNLPAAATQTLDVAGTGAKTIQYGTSAAPLYNYSCAAWRVGEIVGFIYDGTYWRMLKPAIAGTSTDGVVRIADYLSSDFTMVPGTKLLYNVGTSIAPRWVKNTTYSVGDYVMYEFDGKLYKAKVDIPTNTSWNASNWEEVKVMDEMAAGGGGTGSYSLTTPEQTTSTTTTTNDTITVQLSDHAINTVQVPTTATNVVMKFPQQEIGKARDFFVRLIVTGSTVPSITLTEPDGSAIDFDVDDDSWTEIEKGVNLLMFTETAQ